MNELVLGAIGGLVVGLGIGIGIGYRLGRFDKPLIGGLKFMPTGDPVIQQNSLNINQRYTVTSFKTGEETNPASALDDLVLTVESGPIGTVEDPNSDDSEADFVAGSDSGSTGVLVGTAKWTKPNGDIVDVEARAEISLVESGGTEPTDFVLVFREITP